jgi:hypothetical protein
LTKKVTTLNRTSISIMNLSAKSLGQLAIFAVALFFFSCDEEASIVGYKNPVSKFKSGYVEIPITTSVLLFDSVRTSNVDADNDLNRLLVGKYTDPVFGPVTSTAYSQFAPSTLLVQPHKDSAHLSLVFESIELQLFTDFYMYGSDGVSAQKFSVHALTQDIPYVRTKTVSSTAGGQQKPVQSTYRYKKYYRAESTAAYSTELAQKEFTVDAAEYKNMFNGESTFDSTYVTADLDDAFGEAIFDLMDSEDFKADYSLLDKSAFLEAFKGIAIVPTDADKIVGFFINPLTRVRMTYLQKRTNGTIKSTHYIDFPLGIGQEVSFNSIIRDFTGTPLDGLTTPYQEFDPGNNLRYIAAGSRVVTKLDFSKFIEFAHSDSISRMSINSAEFLIKNIEEPGIFDPPPSLVVKLIDDDNRPKKLAYPGRSTQYSTDLNAITKYQGTINFDYQNYSISSSIAFDSSFVLINDIGRFLTLNYSADSKSYSGTGSLFFQQLFMREEGDPLFTKAILMPYMPSQTSNPAFGYHTVGKTLNRVAFNKDNIVLRIYYTVPTVNITQ